MWDGFNKRKFPRISLDCQVSVSPQGKMKILNSKTENLGAGGVCLITSEEVSRFDRCHFKIEMPGSEAIDGKGKVVWVIPRKVAKDPQTTYDVGIEFTDFEGDGQKRLMQFLASRPG